MTVFRFFWKYDKVPIEGSFYSKFYGSRCTLCVVDVACVCVRWGGPGMRGGGRGGGFGGRGRGAGMGMGAGMMGGYGGGGYGAGGYGGQGMLLHKH